MKPIIIKVGGSLITDRESETPLAKPEIMREVAHEIYPLFERGHSLVLIHGAGSYGHPIVHKHDLHKGLNREDQKIILGEVQLLQYELNVLFTRILMERGFPCFSIQASSSAILKNRELQSMDFQVVQALVEKGIIPVLYGVPAYDSAQGVSILSGDTLVPYLALQLKASLVIHLTEAGGVFDEDPKEAEKKGKKAHREGQIIEKNWEEVKKCLGISSNKDVTGGMMGKVLESYRLSLKGIPVLITGPGKLQESLEGEEGTWIGQKKIAIP